MANTKQIPILGSKAIIFRNKYDVWQFRMYVKNALKYVEKSLRVKEQALKEHKKNAVATVKKLIVDYKLTKGDIRGKALKQSEL
jgi:hypothetical protein